ncbi:MAG: aldehyde ferredoxin oxidoreductase family protein [Spirochaetales bacterium]|nr:aldehyde ferredoxin oxidoreductase family protein [Spirochaetales bacterium]MCF7938471.1 aldehyde ferredoxin oxidoreductase family protein [Spirochaetales bacterium]
MSAFYKGAYMGKLLRVNLTDRTSSVEAIPEEWFKKLLGGRGLAAKYYYNEIGPEVDPFDAENKLIMMSGPLTGLTLPAATKFQFSTKAPETGHYLCSNSSGRIGTQLKKNGYDGMIIEGKADDWIYIKITADGVEFCDARDMAGENTDKVLEKLYKAVGSNRAGALAIGPAAEKLVRVSYVCVDTRAFGRGGGGAVFGSKKLKGVVVYGTGEIPAADPEKLKEIQKGTLPVLRETRGNHTKYGTAQYIQPINELGCMPTRNFQTTHFEGGDKVDHNFFYENYKISNYACDKCPVACGSVGEVKEGPYKGSKARTEYENIGLLGPNCGVDDFAAIIAANELCDKIGLDTMSGANLVALSMELFERGLITTDDTEGIEARFGSGEALLGMLRLIAERRGIGELLAEGMKGVEKARPEWKPYIVHVKGMSPAAYDPRGFYGHALTIGTSSRGACHNVGGWTIRDELQSGKYDRFALDGKGELVHTIQNNRAYIDSLGICTVVRGSMDFRANPHGETMFAATGYDFEPELMEIGNRIYNLERVILNREGIDRKDDILPDRFLKEVVPSGPIKGQQLTEEMYNRILDDYYSSRGWGKNGIVPDTAIDKCGLKDLTA